MDSYYQVLYEQYQLLPTYENLLTCVSYLNSQMPFNPEILEAIYQQNLAKLFERRQELENFYGKLILRHLYFNVELLDPYVTSSGVQLGRGQIVQRLIHSLAHADSLFVVNELQKMVNMLINQDARDVETLVIQGCYALSEIPETPELYVYQFLRDLIITRSPRLVNAASATLAIIGTKKDIPYMVERILGHSQEESWLPIGLLKALSVINGPEAIEGFIQILRNTQNQGIIEYTIFNLGIAIMTSQRATDLGAIRTLLQRINEQNRSQRPWTRHSTGISETLRTVDIWFRQPERFATSSAEVEAYTAINRYRGDNPVATAKDILKLAVQKVGWSAPTTDESLDNWMDRIILEFSSSLHFQQWLENVTVRAEWLRQSLARAVNYAIDLDLFNCAQEIRYLVTGFPDEEDD